MDCERLHQSDQWLKPEPDLKTSYSLGSHEPIPHLGSWVVSKMIFLCREGILLFTDVNKRS